MTARSSRSVAMLMWEISPQVAGGMWTACYHLVRNLRFRHPEVEVTVVVPWAQEHVAPAPFDHEVPVMHLGMPLPRDVDGLRPRPYGGRKATLLSMREDFTARIRGLTTRFDIVHAHDWHTFEAAERLAENSGSPWIAHFHSTEMERRLEPDPVIEEHEHHAVTHSTAVVVPSMVTKSVVAERYGRRDVHVVPNNLSIAAPVPKALGAHAGRTVIYLGRLAWQKGPDRFAELAARVHATDKEARFIAYGAGDREAELVRSGHVTVAGLLEWQARYGAYRDATVLVVPSRHEPFGMTVLEGMYQRVAVVYPRTSGAAEVLSSGVQVDGRDVEALTTQVVKLLEDANHWGAVVDQEWNDVRAFVTRHDEDLLVELWGELSG